MFTEIRNRLTLLYTVVMAVFLLAFIVVSDAGVVWVLHHEEQQDIKSFAEEEAKEHITMLKQKKNKMELKEEDNTDTMGGKIFFYVFDDKGQLVDTEESAMKVRSKVQEIISNWNVADGEGTIRKFYLPEGERAILIMCSLKIYDGEDFLGRVLLVKTLQPIMHYLKHY